jgi:hypothetical protein
MPFSKDVRTRALVASARHCCVCHKHRGIKVEVHHITPEALGGANSLENAITLCFDCHADVGHYNENHPRGSKFTPHELRLAREKWHKIVQENRIPEPSEPEALHCRYIIGKSFEFLSEVASSNMTHFPLEETLLVRTRPLDFLRELTRRYANPTRPEELSGEVFPDERSFVQARPDSKRIPDRLAGFEYFRYERTPSAEELYTRVAQEDGVTRLLLLAKLPSGEIARALAYEDACQGGFPENYRLRPLWGAFLAITNVSDNVVRLNAIEGSLLGSHFEDLQPLSGISSGDVNAISLPAAPIGPHASILVPIATILAPLQHIPFETGYQESRVIGHFTHPQTFSHTVHAEDRSRSSYAWGPLILPRQVSFTMNGAIYSQSLHTLDLTNVYEIDRHWMMGSCPHAFAITDEGLSIYLGEVIPQGNHKWSISQIHLPPDTHKVIIAELEDEVSIFRYVECGAQVVCRNRTLNKGDSISFIPGASTVTIEGMYLPHGARGLAVELPAVRRNNLVSNCIPIVKHLPRNAP